MPADGFRGVQILPDGGCVAAAAAVSRATGYISCRFEPGGNSADTFRMRTKPDLGDLQDVGMCTHSWLPADRTRRASLGPGPTGVGPCRQGPEVRAAVSRGTASRRGEGSGGTAEGKGDTPAQRTAPGRGGRPQGRRTFGPVKSSTALLLEKVAKAQMFVYSAAEKESAWKD